jgi:Mrp family chromosome partitioning ATPase
MSKENFEAFSRTKKNMEKQGKTWNQGETKKQPQQASKEDFKEPMNAFSNIKNVIGVVSGKGGVGKSFVTSSLAVQMAKKGYKVGILDADITGPSIPKMFGLKEQVVGDHRGMLPIETKEGIKVISINLLMDNEEAPVIWRGPVIAGVVKQFWNETCWGDLDYLFVDMPPGTGDVPLTVFQSLPVEGIVIVTSPQELVQMIVKKAYNMANMMNIKVLGVVENFSYLLCPDCGKQIKLFGESHIDDVAKELGIEVLGKLPLNPEAAQIADEGKFFEIDNEEMLSKAIEVLQNTEKVKA